MLPAKLPTVLKNVAADADLEGDRYGIVFFREPPDNVVEKWGRAEVYGTLQASPEDESLSNEYFEATSVETVELPDGAEASLRRMEPVRHQGGTQGPFWEGRFDEGAHTYTLTLLDDTSRQMATQVLATMVEVSKREPTKAKQSSSSPKDSKTAGKRRSEEEAVEDAIRGHYEAIGTRDFGRAYDYFGPTYRAEEDRQGWVENHEADQIKSSTINALNVEEVSGSTATANVDVSFEDKTGTPRFRITWSLVKEGGRWKLDEQLSAEKMG
jgi:hypothetical protein